ncbi:hypothetical protein GSF08_00845 [Clostridiaceae bacterium DONG20-135]|uniref:Uncharacterized protein n=1 Tax=Copranaerobaculum intestinale TaxID=2692629 RepID=A0A6N8U7H2_9FIRM|nr:hypothetical protein [Copranaerobaculum intestinale]MXQ72489.1 hypothetical protein [Copranaerobaculum intestinale]
MFDNKNRKDELSSDELELMKMIKEYEQDEAAEQLRESEEVQDEYNTKANQYEPVSDQFEDTALINRCDRTKVMSRDQLEDKTLTIMPVSGVKPKEESGGQTQNLDFSQLDEDAEDDDPRFELHRNKDKKPKQKKDKKPKKGKKKDEKLNKTVIITIVVASVIALIAGGVLVYNSFFKDKKADDDKITDVTKKKTKKKTTKKTEDKEEEKETPKDDHSAEIKTLQGLIEQERTKYNDYISQVNTKQEELNAYNTSLNTLQNKVAEAQKAIDDAGGEENVTEAMRTELANAQENLAKFKNNNPNPPTQASIDELNRKARECQDNITNYQNQISQYQNS